MRGWTTCALLAGLMASAGAAPHVPAGHREDATARARPPHRAVGRPLSAADRARRSEIHRIAERTQPDRLLPSSHGSNPGGADREAQIARASRWLAEQADEAFLDRDPQPGLLPALVGLALWSCGEDDAAVALEARLFEQVDTVVEGPAQLAAFHFLVAMAPPEPDWSRRQPILDRWLETILREQFATWRQRDDGGGLDARRTPRSRAERNAATALRTPWSIALACAGVRAYERIGAVTDQATRRIPGPWHSLAASMIERTETSGSVRWPDRARTTETRALSTALVLALARPMLLQPRSMEEATHRLHGDLDEAEAQLIKCAERDAFARHESAWHRLAAAVLRARLKWTAGVPVSTHDAWLSNLFDGEAFQINAPLPWLTDRAQAQHWNQPPIRRLVATSLALLAWTGAGRQADNDARFTAFSRADALARESDANTISRLSRLVQLDGLAGGYAALDALLEPSDAGEPFAWRVATDLTGWDLGRDGDAPRAAIERFHAWLQAERLAGLRPQPWQGRTGRSLAAVASVDTPLGRLDDLVRLARHERASGDLLSALQSPSLRERTVAVQLLRDMGAPLGGYAVRATEPANSAALDRLTEWMREHL